MSSMQSDLGEFSPTESDDKGVPLAERIGRDTCGAECRDGDRCKLPVVPGRDWCHEHLDGDENTGGDGPDYSHQLAIATASEDGVDASSETRCPECKHPVASMYLVAGEVRACPECNYGRA